MVVGAGALLFVVAVTQDAAKPEPARPAAPPATSITIAAPPTTGENPSYVGHRAPLMAEPLLKLPVGSVRARGWLDAQVSAMALGMFGRLPRFSHWVVPEGSAWRSKDGKGENGWEELPYWLKGLTSLGYVLDAESAFERENGKIEAMFSQPPPPTPRELAVGWLEAILASQRDDGYFGPESNRALPDLWPNMPVLWAMRTWYEATNDPHILAFLAKYFRYELELPREKLLSDSWQKVRGGDNLEIIHWLYDRTGEPWLLDLAQKIHERTADWVVGIPSWHGVNFCQGFREPLQYFVQSHDPAHRYATLRNYAEMMEKFGQVPGGMFGADENCRPGHSDPRQGAEACSMVEFMASFEMLGAQTGETIWFDRCEEVAFNSLPAAMDDDLRSLHYLTAPNLVACDSADHSPGFENSGCMLAFSPDERYRCCQHNVVQGWPYFVEHLWSATRDRGLATCLYAPCQVAARAGDGADVRIAVDTRYPFEGDVVVAVRSTPPSRFPLYFRVPRWCDGVADISIDGRASKAGAKGGDFVKMERQWDFSVVRLRFPQAIEVKLLGPDRDRVSVSRGPLTYSLAIEEEWSWSDIGDLWSLAEVHAGSPWNYALELGTDPQVLRFEPTELDLVSAALGGRSFEHAVFAPFSWVVEPRIIARARRVPAWQVDSTGLVAPMQPGPVVTDEPVEEVRLLPMGCARLRISAFPAVAAAGEGHVWKTPAKAPRASHVHDDPLALTDGVLPKRSNDHDVPRFTFWDHVGTVEWVQQEFDVPRLVSHCGVYWFDDTGTGRCRVPKSWRVLWLDDSGDWREVAKPSSYGVAKDSMNEVTFEPVATKSLRLEVTLQPDFSAGMFEWSVGE